MLPLLACSTPPVQPPIVINNVCTPPKEIMTENGDLPLILGPTLTEKQILDQWLSDIQSYNSLNIEHSSLIKWINKHCNK